MNIVERIIKIEKAIRRLMARSFITYAKGSWTPVLAGSTIAGTFTYTNQVGKYTRVGDTCFFYCRVSISVITVAPTGNLQITGLPFAGVTIGGAAGVAGGGYYAIWSGITLPAGYTQLSARIIATTTIINITRDGSAVGGGNVLGGELALVAGAANFEVHGQYRIA